MAERESHLSEEAGGWKVVYSGISYSVSVLHDVPMNGSKVIEQSHSYPGSSTLNGVWSFFRGGGGGHW